MRAFREVEPSSAFPKLWAEEQECNVGLAEMLCEFHLYLFHFAIDVTPTLFQIETQMS
jgi:hypothetical protein